MTSLLRKLVASPRIHHAEAGLDLCYEPPSDLPSAVIATSGPSSAYPQRAYRNPLSSLVKFLDATHGDKWAIWEFRAEGTGYADEAVYGRIRHFPWPDHHPPPFGVVVEVMSSLAAWLEGDKGRVAVLHCKAGKGRSGTIACAYLISQHGWSASEALSRFTERRMRAGFGQGVSIPSQVRWVNYVARWTHDGKAYLEREVEVVEVHVWGLRDGVKVGVRGFGSGGREIRAVHVFGDGGRWVVDAGETGQERPEEEDRSELAQGSRIFKPRMSWKDGSPSSSASSSTSSFTKEKRRTGKKVATGTSSPPAPAPLPPRSNSTSNLALPSHGHADDQTKSDSKPLDDSPFTPSPPNRSLTPNPVSSGAATATTTTKLEPGGSAVLFKPSSPNRIILSTNDINIDFERRNNLVAARRGWTMVTSVAHVWFNALLEGGESDLTREDLKEDTKGEENGNVGTDRQSQNGNDGEESTRRNRAEHNSTANKKGNSVTNDAQGSKTTNPHAPPSSGVFSITWDEMDGIKGSTKKGVRAFDRMAVVWRVAPTRDDAAVHQSPIFKPQDASSESAEEKPGRTKDSINGAPSMTAAAAAAVAREAARVTEAATKETTGIAAPIDLAAPGPPTSASAAPASVRAGHVPDPTAETNTTGGDAADGVEAAVHGNKDGDDGRDLGIRVASPTLEPGPGPPHIGTGPSLELAVCQQVKSGGGGGGGGGGGED